MRELKFRAWHKERFFGSIGRFEYFNLYKDAGEILDDWFHNDDNFEQYTGLKDKNGKEIYEGDIVDYNDDGECIGIVKYDAPEFYLDADATNGARMFLKGAPHQRVIGNIHENPELVEEEE